MKKILLFFMIILAACSEDNSVMSAASENEEAVIAKYDTVYSVINAYDTIHRAINAYDTVHSAIDAYDTIHSVINAYDTVHSAINAYDTVHSAIDAYDTVHKAIDAYDTVHKAIDAYDTIHSVINAYDTVKVSVVLYDTIKSSDIIVPEEILSSSSISATLISSSSEEALSSSSSNIFKYNDEELNVKYFTIDTFSTFIYDTSVYTLITETVSCEYIGLKPVNDVNELKAISKLAFKEANDTTKNYFWFLKDQEYGVLCPDSTLELLPTYPTGTSYTPENCIIKDSGVFSTWGGAKGSCRWTNIPGNYTCTIKNINFLNYVMVRACKY